MVIFHVRVNLSVELVNLLHNRTRRLVDCILHWKWKDLLPRWIPVVIVGFF